MESWLRCCLARAVAAIRRTVGRADRSAGGRGPRLTLVECPGQWYGNTNGVVSSISVMFADDCATPTKFAQFDIHAPLDTPHEAGAFPVVPFKPTPVASTSRSCYVPDAAAPTTADRCRARFALTAGSPFAVAPRSLRRLRYAHAPWRGEPKTLRRW